MLKNDYYCWDCKNFKGYGAKCFRGVYSKAVTVAHSYKGKIHTTACKYFYENDYVKGIKVKYGN